jgi:hypothetical protein
LGIKRATIPHTPHKNLRGWGEGGAFCTGPEKKLIVEDILWKPTEIFWKYF